MTMKMKQELISQVITLLNAMIEVDAAPPITMNESKSQRNPTAFL